MRVEEIQQHFAAVDTECPRGCASITGRSLAIVNSTGRRRAKPRSAISQVFFADTKGLTRIFAVKGAAREGQQPVPPPRGIRKRARDTRREVAVARRSASPLHRAWQEQQEEQRRPARAEPIEDAPRPNR